MNISTQQVVTRAKRRLRLVDSSENDGYLEKLIEEGARSLNATDTYIVSCEETPIDCLMAKLPDQYEELICFVLNPSDVCSGCCGQILSTTTAQTGTMPQHNCCCVNYYYFNNKFALTNNCGASCGWYGNYFGIQNNYIVFPSTTTATSIKIYFKGWHTDKNGIMIPTQEQERALSAYAAFQFALESPPNVYTPYQINQWNAEWKSQKSYLNGTRVVRDAKLRSPEITTIMNSILYFPLEYGFGR